MDLTDAFNAVFVLNLAHRPDRLKRLLMHLENEAHLWSGSDRLHVVSAICGDDLPPPNWWGAGNGAWGCLLSHARVIETAMAMGLDNWLVLEDDVVFHAHAKNHLRTLIEALPRDWGQLYLGGQHLRDPVHQNDLLFRAGNVNRTHAFAMTRRVAAKVHAHILHAPDYIDRKAWHIDHQLGLGHERNDWPVYAPKWWLAGQEAGSSNISGRQIPRQYWQPGVYARELPFFWGPSSSTETEAGLHWGNNPRADQAWSDIGLNDAVGNPERLQRWLDMIAREAISLGRLPAAWHECLTVAEIARLWPTGVYAVDRFDPELLDYPWNGLFAHPYAALPQPPADPRPAPGPQAA